MTEQLKISFDSSIVPDKNDNLPNIGIFGRKNYGKSSFVNVLIGSQNAQVSKVSGTTTEPVKYYSTLEGIGDIILIDTSGIDDYGDTGEKRIIKTLDTLKIIDFAILIITGNLFAEPEKKLVSKFQEYFIPFIIIHNKSDIHELLPISKGQIEAAYQTKVIEFTCTSDINLIEFTSALKNLIPESAFESKSILGDIVEKNNLVLLGVPDKMNAPEGQLTKSQVEITRDLLENSCYTLFAKLSELNGLVKMLQPKPRLVVLPTSSFKKYEELLPAEMLISTYGILMSRHKGNFKRFIEDTSKLSALKEGDKILILQAVTDSTTIEYKEQEEIQKLINNYGKKIEFTIMNIFDKPVINLNQFHFAVICGIFLLTKKQIAGLIKPLTDMNIPVSSFDMVNAFVKGVFERATFPFISEKK